MNSKKAITLLVLATLILSMLPVIPSQAALGTVNIDSDTGSYGDDLEVSGAGVTAGATVDIYWDLVQAWDPATGQGKIASAKAFPNGTFKKTIEVPEAVFGKHYVWVKDTNTAESKQATQVNGTDWYKVTPTLVMDPESGLPGDTITVDGYGYGADEDILDLWFANNTIQYSRPMTPATPSTDDLGSWTATWKVPSVDKVDYQVNATDGTHVSANQTFTVGASISLSKVEGPTGTVVKISGRGFDVGAKLDKTNVTITDGVFSIQCYVLDAPVTVDGQGKFTLQCVIPYNDTTNAIDIDDDYEIQVEDGPGAGVGGNKPKAEFDVTGAPGITVTPQYQVQGGTITVAGENYTMVSGKKVLLYLDQTKIGEATTTSSGTFSKTVTVPAVASGTYRLYAEMADYNLNGTKKFRVGMMIVILSPDSGATGEQVTLTATGFTADGTYNVTIGGESINEVGASDTVGSDGTISVVLTVPTLPVGVHTVEVLDIDEDITVTTEFEVTDTATITLDPSTVPNEFMVIIDGMYFTQLDDTSLTFQIYNASGAWDITVGNDTAAEVSTNADGEFSGNWTIFDTDTLDLGTYYINVTDGNGVYAEAMLVIVDETVSIDPRKSTFRIGETVAFNIETSFAVPNSYIKIWDPTGNLYWQTDVFGANVWVSLDLTKIVPFYSQTAGGNPMLLLDDAPIGDYSWKWYNDGDDDIAKNSDDEVIDEGTFAVAEAAADVVAGQVEDLANDITDLANQLNDVTSEFDNVKSDIADLSAIAEQAVAAANAATDAVNSVAATANQANTAAENAATAAEAARDAANGLTTLVYGAIGAALVAALAAIVSLMQISRRIAG